MSKKVPVVLRYAVPIGSSWVVAQVPFKRTIWIRPGIQATRRLLAHELRHVIQAESRSWPLAYFWQWLVTGRDYYSMPFEIEARAAEKDPFYLEWADEVIREQTPIR